MNKSIFDKNNDKKTLVSVKKYDYRVVSLYGLYGNLMREIASSRDFLIKKIDLRKHEMSLLLIDESII